MILHIYIPSLFQFLITSFLEDCYPHLSGLFISVTSHLHPLSQYQSSVSDLKLISDHVTAEQWFPITYLLCIILNSSPKVILRMGILWFTKIVLN